MLLRFDSSSVLLPLLYLLCVVAPFATGFSPNQPLHRALSIGQHHLQPSDSVLRLRTQPRQLFLLGKKSVQENTTTTATKPTTSQRRDDLDQKEQILVNAIEQLLQNEEPSQDDSAQTQTTMPRERKSSGNSKYVGVPGDDHLIWDDPALRIVSSEVGIKQFIGEESDDAAVARAILFERTLDTLEDIMVHIRRIPYDMGMNDMPMYAKDQRKTVVVLGSGWASHALMKVADCCKVRLIVVSKSNHFVFTPMLASAAVGTVEYRSMTEAVRAANPMIDSFLEGKAIDVDIYNKTVKVQLNSLLEDFKEGDPPIVDIPYDHLVVAVGNQVSFYDTPGAEQKCLRLKSCDDARRLRTALGECFEFASRPDVASDEAAEERSRRVTFVVVGGGPTGVELAGELSDLAHDITRERVGAYPKLADAVKVILVHGGSELLPQFEEDLRHEALRALEKRGVEVRLNTRVTEVKKDEVLLSSKVFDQNGNPTDERVESTLKMGLAIWCAGIAPVPFVDKLLHKLPELARGAGGRVNVDRWLRPPMPTPELRGSIMVLGDAASLQSRKKSLLPQTAQVAGQQGAYIARLLVRGYDLNAETPVLPESRSSMGALSNATLTDPAMEAWLKFRNLDVAPGFSFLNLGLLAYLGGGKALSQVQVGDVPVFSYAGSVAFILWRSVYLVKQVATRNRVLVTFDWIKSFLFGRDITRL